MKKNIFHWLNILGGESLILLLGGVGIILIVCVARMLGFLEGLELQTLDLLLKSRPFEPTDERITLIEFTDDDIQELKTYPIPDSVITQLIEDLQDYEPRVIGLDIFRDIPVADPIREDFKAAQDANRKFLNLLIKSPNIVVIDKILNFPIQAPPGLPQNKIGFADILLDRDGFVRRSLLASPSHYDQDYHFSFTIQLASKYLVWEGFELENGIRDPTAMRFGDQELFRIKSDSGGYFNQDTGDNPVILISFRNSDIPFNKLSWSDFRSGDFPKEWITNRVIIVGMNAASAKDYINSAAIFSDNPGLVPGIELQAHAVSQIISAVIDGRPILRTWAASWEYLAIILAGIIGITFIQIQTSRTSIIIVFLGLVFLPFILGCGLIITGIWIPVFPIFIVIFLTSSSTLLYRIYQYEQGWKIRLEERQRIIRQSYNTIHNRPLQALKGLMRKVRSNLNISTQELHDELNNIDRELRQIYEFMQREYLSLETRVYLTQEQAIELDGPLHEILHQIYRNKLSESAHFFSTIKLKSPDFSPLPSERLSLSDKEDIARFLEEALSNVEQHAMGVTRLTVICKHIDHQVVVQVIDNGTGLGQDSANNGMLAGRRGTRQANELALRLGGNFSRRIGSPTGTICELSWPVKSPSPWVTGLRWLQIYASRLAPKRR